MSFTGFDEINQRFKQMLNDLRTSRTQKTIEEILIAVRADAATMTPVDTSLLVNSAYTRSWRTTGGWEGAVGYGAEYAGWVHNMPGRLKGQQRAEFGKTRAGVGFGGGTGKGTYWSPDAEPKFLEKAVKNVMTYDIDRIIKEQYMI